ncbi:MAG: hypothetical protein CMF76_10190 [Maricaulis sp.]|nr:hypothetical protein [Maricaulis sp.]
MSEGGKSATDHLAYAIALEDWDKAREALHMLMGGPSPARPAAKPGSGGGRKKRAQGQRRRDWPAGLTRDLLKSALTRHGHTQKDAAAALGTTPATVGNWLKKGTAPIAKHWRSLATYCEAHLTEEDAATAATAESKKTAKKKAKKKAAKKKTKKKPAKKKAKKKAAKKKTKKATKRGTGKKAKTGSKKTA